MGRKLLKHNDIKKTATDTINHKLGKLRIDSRPEQDDTETL